MKHKTIRMAGAIVSVLILTMAFTLVLSIAVGSSLADSGIPDDLLDDDRTPNDSERLDISGQTFLTETGRTRTVVFDIDGGAVTDPELWNPLIPGTRLDQGLHQSVMEPLFILNYATGVIEPWLGLSMTANSTMDVWTLVLRDGVKWSDGEDFDADDVVFTIRTLMSNAPALNWSNAISSSVRSVERLNKTTVRFVLNYPNPRFQLQIFTVYVGGSLPIVPAHIFSGQDPRTFKFYDPVRGWPVFTGPYKVQSVTHTEFIYVRDGNWWGAQAGWRRPPWPEKLVWLWAGNEMSRTQLMATGQLDSLMDIPPDTFSALKSQNTNITAWFDYSPYAWPDPCSRTFELNLARAPWNDKAMRWALNYGIDRDQIVAEAYQGGTVKSEHFFPLYTALNRYVNLAKDAGLYNRYPLEEYNSDKARAAIESKGYQRNADGYYEKDGKELTLDITTHAVYEEFDRVAQVLMAQLKSIGIHATHRTEAGGTWTSHFRTGAFEARLGWQTCGSVYEPYTSMDQLNTKYLKPVGEWAFGNGWRWSGQAANQYSAIVDQIGALPLQDPAIDALFVQATEIYLDELPVIPLVQAKKLVPFDTSYWINWPTALNDYSTPTTWWQGAHKIIHNLVPRELTPRFPQNDPGTHSPLITPTLGVAMTVPRPYFDWHDAQFASLTLTDKADASGDSGDLYKTMSGSGVVSYTLRIDEEVDPGAGVPISVSFIFTTTASNYIPAVDLPNRSYRWTVKAHNAAGYASDWLATQRFSVAASTRLVYLPLVLTAVSGQPALLSGDPVGTKTGGDHTQVVSFQGAPTSKDPPILVGKVRAGELPALGQRLPAIPVVVTPTGRIGVYGGTWHTTSWWPQAGNVLLKMYDPPIRWKADYSGYEPGLAESYEWSPDGKTFTLRLRQGLKWSDGQPYTSEDWRFWWEDMATNADYPSVVVPGYLRKSDGAPITMAFPDSYTVVWSSDTPLWVNPYFMAQGYWEFATSMMKPKHYLMQFHPRYNPAAKYSDLAAADRWWANPDFPTVLSWHCSNEGAGQVTFARNPFYWKVDTEGNQLPYIDYIHVEIVPDETARLQNCAQGRYDAAFRGCGAATDIPFLAANAITGRYHLQAGWVNGAGAWPGYLVNQDYVAGGNNYPDDTPQHAAEIRAVLRDKRFRKALSVGFDRQRVINAAWGGQGFPQQATISPQSPHFASPQGKQVLRNWATSDAQLNVSQANQWLDQVGMLDVNSDGWRELPGGRPFTLTVDLGAWGGSLAVQTNAATDMKSQWEQNLHIRVEISSPQNLDARMRAGYYMLSAGHVAELDIWTYPDWVFPIQNSYMFPLEGQWYATRGTKGMPPEPNSPAARLQVLYDQGMAQPDINQRHQIVWDAIQIHIDDGPFVIGVAGDQPMPVVLKDNFHNVPHYGVLGPWAPSSPGNMHSEQFWMGPVLSTTVPPGGGELNSVADKTVITFPVGTFTGTVVITYTAFSAENPSSDSLAGIGHIFDVTAFYSDTGQPAQPARSYTVTIQYADRESGLVVENTLALYYWDGNKWVKETSSSVDVIANRVTATPSHFSRWAIMGEVRRVFLPVILRQ